MWVHMYLDSWVWCVSRGIFRGVCPVCPCVQMTHACVVSVYSKYIYLFPVGSYLCVSMCVVRVGRACICVLWVSGTRHICVCHWFICVLIHECAVSLGVFFVGLICVSGIIYVTRAEVWVLG